MRSLLGVIVLLFAAVVAAVSTAGNRLLVVLDDVANKDAYATFLGDLSARGFDISYEAPRSETLRLSHLGERTYDHIIFFPTKVKAFGPNLTPILLLDFVKAGGNILVTLSSQSPASTAITSMLSELDVTLPPERTGLVVDHFNYDTMSAAQDHDVLVLDAPTIRRPDIKKFFEIPGGVLAMPRTCGHILGEGPLLTPILVSPWTAYSYDPKEQADYIEPDQLFAGDTQLALVSVMQARNSARITILGSAEMLEDKWMVGAKVSHVNKDADDKPVNREFAKRLSGWTFQEIGVLRVNSVEHRLQGSDEVNPSSYRIKNDVTFSISISEYSWDGWYPFTVPDEDSLQFEFTMLSPFYRLGLIAVETTETATVFSRDFKVPDQHGIFNFRVNYKRPLLTYIDEKRTVSVRHMAHDEWPRSYEIPAAWPYLSGLLAVIIGFLAFLPLWMYCEDDEPRDGQGAANRDAGKDD